MLHVLGITTLMLGAYLLVSGACMPAMPHAATTADDDGACRREIGCTLVAIGLLALIA